MVNIFYTFYFDSSFTFVFGVIADGKSLSADFLFYFLLMMLPLLISISNQLTFLLLPSSIILRGMCNCFDLGNELTKALTVFF